MNNTSTTTCETIDATSTVCTTIHPEYFANGFSYGSILEILFLIFIFTLLFFNSIKNWLHQPTI